MKKLTHHSTFSNHVKLVNHLQLSIKFFTLIFFILISANSFGQIISPVINPKGGFKIDGALRANVTIQAGDWLPRLNSQTFTAGVDSFVFDANGVPKDEVTTRLKRDAFNVNTDDIFTQGSKFNDTIGSLHWGTGGAPDKNDIHNGVFHASGDNAGNQWVFIGGDRRSTSGTSYIDFEFLQGTITLNASTFTGSGPAGGRTLNDINISMEYNNGGSAPKVVIYKWTPTSEAATNFFWDSAGSHLITQAYAKTNLASTDVPFGAFNATSYQAFAFVEAAINITQLVSLAGGNCAGLSIKTLWIKTKASSSSTAALKDFMTPISLDLNFGGVNITPKGPACQGGSNITLEASPSGGTFSGPGVTGTTFSPTDAGVGTHTVVYQATTGVNCIKSASIQIVVNPNPTVTVNSPEKCASDPAVTVTATPGSGAASDYNYVWTFPAAFSDPGNVSSFTTSIAGPYSVVITNKTTECSSPSGGGTVTVNPNPAQPGVNLTQPTCGNSNGTVTVTSPLDGGGIDYEYKNNNGSYQDAVAFSVASGGAYSIVARNKATQCVSTAIAGNMGTAATTPPATAIITQNVDCSHSTGTVKIVQASAGNPEYNNTIFEFSNNGTTWGPDPEFTFVAGGGYNLTVRRKLDHSCTASASCEGEDPVGRNTSNTNTETSARVLGSATLESSITVETMPNPFSNKVRFVINSNESGSGVLDIYNMMGQKIKTVYQGNIPSGTSYIDLTLATRQTANLVYVLRIGNNKMTGKILQVNQ